MTHVRDNSRGFLALAGMNSSSVRSHRFFLAVARLVCLLLLGGSFAFAQTSNTSLSGVVKDPQGNVIANATVILTNAATATTRTQKTGPEGHYSFDLLTPGDYKLEVQATGFRKQTLQSIHVLIAKANTIDVTTAGRCDHRGSHRQCRIQPGDGRYPGRESGQQFHFAADYATCRWKPATCCRCLLCSPA